MASQLFSMRMKDDLASHLEAEARRTGESKSRLAHRLLEEGLRMRAHPGIVFRDGPAGRRPAVMGGPDVWEIIRIATNTGTTGEGALAAIVEHMDLRPDLARAAVGYYAAYPDEIDAWTRSNDELAERMEAAWLRDRVAFTGWSEPTSPPMPRRSSSTT